MPQRIIQPSKTGSKVRTVKIAPLSMSVWLNDASHRWEWSIHRRMKAVARGSTADFVESTTAAKMAMTALLKV